MKFIKYFLIVLLVINFTSAQSDLYVSNGSYVFVDGDGFDDTIANTAPLYVEDDINLASGGNIYLRDEAQLIQGDEAERNIGDGEISIYQEGTVNKWVYNYWCSPVGLPSTTAANGAFDRFNMQEATGLRTSQNFTFLGTGQFNGDDTTTPVEIANAWLYTFTTSDEYSEWNSIEFGTANPGIGYTMKGTNATSGGFDPLLHGQQIDFRGKPNTGTIDVPVLAPVSGDAQWTLTGNPYPSALDMRDLIWDNDNLGADNMEGTSDDLTTGALYYWDQEPSDNSHFIEDYTGGYASVTIDNVGVVSYTAATYRMYDAAGNVLGGPGSTSGKPSPQRYIPVGQGFMIEGLNDGNFSIKNSHRTFYKESGGQSLFFEANNQNELRNNTNQLETDNIFSEEGYVIVPENYKRFRLFVEFNELYTRELLQNFHANATNGFDYGLEAKSPEGVTSDASWTLEGVPYVIQAHSFDENLKIPLVITITENQPLNFRLADVQHFDESQSIYLHDIDNDLYVNLRDQNYDMVLEAGEYTDRFEITFNKETLGLTENDLNVFKVLQNNTLQQLTILNPNSQDVKSVSLIDISGKQIFNAKDLSIQTRYTFSTSNLSEGVYIATLTTEDNNTISEKIIVSNKQ